MLKKLKDIQENVSLNKTTQIPIAVELREAFAMLSDVDDLEVFTYELNKIVKDKILHKENENE